MHQAVSQNTERNVSRSKLEKLEIECRNRNNPLIFKEDDLDTNIWNCISVATKGLTYNYRTFSPFRKHLMQHNYLEYNGKYDSTSTINEIWNVNLLKCVDASPVVVISNCGKSSYLSDRVIEPTVENVIDTVFIGSHSGLFVAVNLKDGKIKWQQQLGGKCFFRKCLVS